MTFDSVHEILTPLTTLRKTKFWDWFDGDDLRSWWSKVNVNGTNTFAMDDAVDGGFKIVTGAVNNNRGTIWFNDINHYSPTASIVIFITKFDNSVSNYEAGLSATNDPDAVIDDKILVRALTTVSFFHLFSSEGTTESTIDSDIARDAVFHGFKIENLVSSAKLFIDGIEKVTKTTNLPDAKIQPAFEIRTRDATTAQANIRYFEAFNT